MSKASIDKHWCSATVYGAGLFRSGCCFQGKYKEGGKYYCGHHLPSRLAEKRKASHDKWQKEWAVKNLKRAKAHSIEQSEANIVLTACNLFTQASTYDDLEQAVSYHTFLVSQAGEGP